MSTVASPEAAVDRAGRTHRVRQWLFEAARTAVGPAEEASQQQDVLRRALITPAIIAIAAIPHLHVPGRETAIGSASAALLYDVPLAYLVFVRKRFFLARLLAFVLDMLLLSIASLFVLRELGEANSNSDLWLAFLVFTVSGGFVLAPVGSLIYTTAATGTFLLGTVLYFPSDSQYQQQLAVRVAFFVVCGLMSLGIAQELEKRRQKLVKQNRELSESKDELEEKSALLARALTAERERARRDPLTGTLNHAAIVETLRQHMAGSTAPLVVAMVDVDSLKAINDTFGHQTGDTVLVTVAEALSRRGALVGRYGGDEFVVVLPGMNRAAAETYRQDVLRALADAKLADPETESRVPVVASIGLASCPEEAESIEDLVKLSDSAMYASRRARRMEANGGLERNLTGRRAAAIVGEIVPLLTAPGALSGKLDLVVHRLAVAAGYDVVTVRLGALHGPPIGQSTYANVPGHLVDAWHDAQRRGQPAYPIHDVLQRTRRPIVVNNAQDDERLSEAGRALMKAASIRSVLITPMVWQSEIIGTLSVASKQPAAFAPRDAQLLVTVAAQVTAIVQMATLVEELQVTSSSLRKAQTETVLLLAAAAEAHDHTTGLHLHEIRAITEALARELGYSEDGVQALGLAAVLHDIGKFRVPDSILATPGQLSDHEWELMKHHTVWGAAFLDGRPGFDLAAVIARSHHERWDGSGYPDGLRGDAIPEAAAIVAVADSFDAMISDRPYRVARPIEVAVREIEAAAGKQFSPQVVEALARLHGSGALHQLRLHAAEREAA